MRARARVYVSTKLWCVVYGRLIHCGGAHALCATSKYIRINKSSFKNYRIVDDLDCKKIRILKHILAVESTKISLATVKTAVVVFCFFFATNIERNTAKRCKLMDHGN